MKESEAIHIIKSKCTIRMILKLIFHDNDLNTVVLRPEMINTTKNQLLDVYTIFYDSRNSLGFSISILVQNDFSSYCYIVIGVHLCI